MNPTTPLFTPENKPFTVLELFEGHPERWTKDEEELSIEKQCFCIMTAIGYVYGTAPNDLFNEYRKKLYRNLLQSPIEWNDAPERIFEDIINKCKELGI